MESELKTSVHSMLMWTNFVKSKSRSDYAIPKKKWLNMSLVNFNGPVQAEDGKPILHHDYIDWFIDELITIVQGYQYIIEDENKFKEEITNFIYTLSDTGTYG